MGPCGNGWDWNGNLGWAFLPHEGWKIRLWLFKLGLDCELLKSCLSSGEESSISVGLAWTEAAVRGFDQPLAPSALQQGWKAAIDAEKEFGALLNQLHSSYFVYKGINCNGVPGHSITLMWRVSHDAVWWLEQARRSWDSWSYGWSYTQEKQEEDHVTALFSPFVYQGLFTSAVHSRSSCWRAIGWGGWRQESCQWWDSLLRIVCTRLFPGWCRGMNPIAFVHLPNSWSMITLSSSRESSRWGWNLHFPGPGPGRHLGHAREQLTSAILHFLRGNKSQAEGIWAEGRTGKVDLTALLLSLDFTGGLITQLKDRWSVGNLSVNHLPLGAVEIIHPSSLSRCVVVRGGLVLQ